jgi:hypothetical protein
LEIRWLKVGDYDPSRSASGVDELFGRQAGPRPEISQVTFDSARLDPE